MTRHYDHGHELASSASVPPPVSAPPSPPPVSGGRRPLATDSFTRLIPNGWGNDDVLVTEDEYASMREAVVMVARLRLMHRPYRGVADVDTCESCSGLTGELVLYPCPTAKVINRRRKDG